MTKRWKKEMQYCAQLVRSKGNENVPHDQIIPYLNDQGARAIQENAPEITAVLSQAVHWIRRGRWDKAEACIKSVFNNKQGD